MNEIMLVSASTEKDPGLIQIGSALSSARVICRFLKNFQKCFARSYKDQCGIVLEIVQLRIALSLETRPPLCFQTLNWHSECSTVDHNVRPVWPDWKQPLNKRHQSQVKKVRPHQKKLAKLEKKHPSN